MCLYTLPGFEGLAVPLIYLLCVSSYFVFHLNYCSTTSIPSQNNSEPTKLVFQKGGTEY